MVRSEISRVACVGHLTVTKLNRPQRQSEVALPRGRDNINDLPDPSARVSFGRQSINLSPVVG